MIGRIITCDADVAEGVDYLAQLEPRFADALSETGPLPLRLRGDGFTALLDAIVSQQVSVASARAIWGRLQEADLTSIQNVQSATEEALRTCGLSRPKVRYAHALAKADIDYPALTTKPTPEVVEILVQVPGIGRWSADIYTMFSLGRADVFASGDLALQEAARLLFELEARPSEKQMLDMALAWQPWRSVAARLLWAYYRVAKQREGLK
ncbi:MAG: DNA-3-methyladenine glycosylase family protein [Paracoccaceae bacterium]